MPDHVEFLQTIADNPESDARRLVYADLLEEKGDLRAELIRVQCSLSESKLSGICRSELRSCERTLLLHHERAWRTELPALDGVEWEGFERGFVAWAKVRNAQALNRHAESVLRNTLVRGLTYCPPEGHWTEQQSERVTSYQREDDPVEHFQQFFRCPSLRGFSGLRVAHLLGDRLGGTGARLVAECPYLTDLSLLSLIHQEVGDEGVEALASSRNLSSLTDLSLAGNGLSSRALMALAHSPNICQLRRLDLAGAHFEDGGEHFFDPDAVTTFLLSPNAVHLSVLDLYWCHLADVALEGLTSTGMKGPLRCLHLGRNLLGADGAAALATAQGLSGLEELTLSVNPLGTDGIQRLAQSAVLANLRSLDVGWTGLTPESVRLLANTNTLRRLEALDVAYNDLGDEGVGVIADGPAFGGLVMLRLASLTSDGTYGPLTAAGVHALAKSAHLALLSELDLSGNEADSKAVSALATSASLHRLRRLNWSRANAGEGAVRALVNSPLAKRLTELALSFNAIESEAGRYFLDRNAWPEVRRLDLEGNAIDPGTVSLLRKAWGSALVIRD